MKTAEEWAGSVSPEDLNILEFIKTIQLDAWQQGMSDAKDIVENNGALSPDHWRTNLVDIQQVIDEGYAHLF